MAEGLFQQVDSGWRSRRTDDCELLSKIMFWPNPWLTGPMPPPPLRQFPRQPGVYDCMGEPLVPWQREVLASLGIDLLDRLAEVRAQLQAWLDSYQGKPLPPDYAQQLDDTLDAWQAASSSRWVQLIEEASRPYGYYKEPVQ